MMHPWYALCTLTTCTRVVIKIRTKTQKRSRNWFIKVDHQSRSSKQIIKVDHQNTKLLTKAISVYVRILIITRVCGRRMRNKNNS